MLKFFIKEIYIILIKEISFLFEKETIILNVEMTDIIKNENVNSLNSLSVKSIYNNLIDFNSLKNELFTWEHSKNLNHFQETLKILRNERL